MKNTKTSQYTVVSLFHFVNWILHKYNKNSGLNMQLNVHIYTTAFFFHTCEQITYTYLSANRHKIQLLNIQKVSKGTHSLHTKEFG